jgi:DNA adenine methylase
LTDLECAARFLYLQKTAFGGIVMGQTFGVTRYGGARFDLTRLAPLLEEVHDRMTGVVIECLGWAEFIDRWDRQEMLFYLDPPYWNGESDYGKGVFGRADFAAPAKRLRRLKGTFVLSINDLPDVRKVFADFKLAPVSLTYTITGGRGTPAKELIIAG